MFSEILGTASYLPDRIVRNEELSQFPPSAIPLIASKTGVCARRYAAEDQCTSDLAAEAARRCLAHAGLEAGELDGIILATSTPDQPMPATCAHVQSKIGAWNAFAVDVNAVCAGAVFALRIADAQIKAGQARRLLVIAAEVYSRILNPTDFSTYPYFGDGAGAVLLGKTEKPTRPYIIGGVLHSDGRGFDVVKIPAGGSRIPASKVTDPRQHYFQMNGRVVFDFAVTRGSEIIEEMCCINKLPKDQICHVVAHQANVNVLRAIAQKTGLEMNRFIVNLDQYGNTAAASVLIAFDELRRECPGGELQGNCMIVAFGGGLAWGGILVSLP
jgi:3-oxoacyl-[acyl-carrier-protein] synthase-3